PSEARSKLSLAAMADVAPSAATDTTAHKASVFFIVVPIVPLFSGASLSHSRCSLYVHRSIVQDVWCHSCDSGTEPKSSASFSCFFRLGPHNLPMQRAPQSRFSKDIRIKPE